MTDIDTPLVTIGIPTYNRADRNLRNAICDALSQTYENIEVIVSDNCSTDHTESLVTSITDSRLKYFRHEKNIGPNENFNFCLEQAAGKFFLLLHDDDSIDADMIELCIRTLAESDDPGLIRCGARVIDTHGNVIHEAENNADSSSFVNFVSSWLNHQTPIYFCSTLYHTERLKNHGALHSKTNMYEDVVAIFRLAAEYPVNNIKAIKGSFRRHLDNRGASADVLNDWIEDGVFLRDLIVDLSPESSETEIRSQANLWLCNQMYQQAGFNQSFVSRIIAYFRISAQFDHRYPAYQYLYWKEFRLRARGIKRKVKARLEQLSA
jgi:glycosyltransferase involved in cell wall biosynthesis